MTTEEANAIPASGSDTRNGDNGLYCVIAASVANGTFGRTWKKTQEDAVKHAKKIIRNSVVNGRPRTEKLFVVQIVEVVEVPQMDITSRRLSTDDVEDLTSVGE
jgi:hypothetical protein